MKRIIFVQPTVPQYRVPFFNKIAKLCGDKFEVVIYASLQDENNAKTVKDLSVFGELSLFFVSFFKFPLINAFWQNVLCLKLSKDDILILDGNLRYLSNMYLFFYAKIIGCKIYWWGHGMSATSKLWRAKIRIYFMRFFNHVFLYTDKEVLMLEKLGFGTDNITGLNNGLDIRKIREKFTFNANKESCSKLLFIGRLRKNTDFNLLLDFLRLDKTGVKLTVIGGGEFFELYNNMAKELNVNDKINWLGPVYDDDIIEKQMQECDCFVYPGSVGLSLIHAFAFGLPAVLHDDFSQHMPEYAAFQDGYNGKSFKRGDINTLSNAIYEVLSCDDFRFNAYETVSNNFNTDNMALRMFKVLSNGDF